MEVLFDGIDMGDITTSMTINGPAAIAVAQYIAAAEKKGIPRAKLGGTIQADILKEYIAQKEWIFPPRPHMRIIVDMIKFCTAEMPKWNTISISGYHIREAGSTAVEEIAFTLSNGKAYLRAAQEAGIALQEVAPRISFFWNAHNDFFEEIAKFRAARYLWAKIVRDDFGCRDSRSQMLRFHTQTGGSTLTAQEPENNVVRVTLQALAAVLGGTQSLHTNGKDEALALPTAQSAKVALRTQQIIAYESGVADVVDPMAGSYYLETLTNDLIARAAAIVGEVDAMGGSIAAIESGWMQARIADSSYAAQQAIERGEQVVVGVNKFAEESGDAPIPLQQVDERPEREQVERLRALRVSRDAQAVERRLSDVRAAAAGGENLMPFFVDAVDDGATLGEICNVLREVFGTYRAREVVA
jgi:methylmalonyl-CoA mutase N-terminal domain/subunit